MSLTLTLTLSLSLSLSLQRKQMHTTHTHTHTHTGVHTLKGLVEMDPDKVVSKPGDLRKGTNLKQIIQELHLHKYVYQQMPQTGSKLSPIKVTHHTKLETF